MMVLILLVLALHNFLVGMPKGADLHVHLSGAVYAESWLRAAAEDGMCVDTKALSFSKAPAGGCPHAIGQVAAHELVNRTDLPGNQALYDKLIDAYDYALRSAVTANTSVLVLDAELPRHLGGVSDPEPERYVGAGVTEHGGEDVVRDL